MHARRGCRHELSVGARRPADQHALSVVDSRPGRLQARGEGQGHTRGGGIAALAQVEMVDRSRLDPDENLALSRLRIRDLLQLERLWPAGLAYNDRAHVLPPSG